jgi:signal transduction histidine kinase
LGWPITLGVIMIVLLVVLLVGWILLTVAANQTNSGVYWAILAIGATFLVLVLVGVVLYLLISIKEIRLNQRQSNFVDSVTHELKSPIASMKLYLQTLSRRSVSAAEQAAFFRFMLEDLERLDSLIDHMLDAARVDQQLVEGDVRDVDLAGLLASAAATACQRYHLPTDTVRLDVEPARVQGRALEIEVVFRNLIDNALKYAGVPPEVEVYSRATPRGTVLTRITDNGPGIPAKLRRKVFGRFVRLGSELERSKTGTGLGLFIVRTLVKRMRGTIQICGRGALSGTIFEVELPGAAPKNKAVPSADIEPLADRASTADGRPQSIAPTRDHADAKTR